jgi:peptidoglycan-associated lipoprotein
MSFRARVLLVLPLLTAAVIATGCARSRPAQTSLSDGASDASATGAHPSGAEAASPATGASTQGRKPFSPGDYKPIDGLREVHFDFDKTDVRADEVVVLDRNASWMLEHRGYAILIEGHADARGTAEYNLALSDKRAKSAMNYLVSKGVAASRFVVVGYGEERPLCRESSEGCWAKNRRAAFLVKPE